MMDVGSSPETKDKDGIVLNSYSCTEGSHTQKRIASPRMTLLKNLTVY